VVHLNLNSALTVRLQGFCGTAGRWWTPTSFAVIFGYLRNERLFVVVREIIIIMLHFLKSSHSGDEMFPFEMNIRSFFFSCLLLNWGSTDVERWKNVRCM